MNKCKKIMAVILSVVILIGICPYVLAQNSDVGYIISGEMGDREVFTVNVSIHNVNAVAGRLAIAFDSEKLELADASTLSKAVLKGSGITITSEGLDTSVLLSQEKGHVMFAWYPTSTSVDALSEDKVIATIPFKLKNGYTTDDFSRNTVGLKYITSNMYDKWSCGAQIVAKGLDSYTSNSKTEEFLCNMTYNYPNSDYVPVITHKATIKASTMTGSPIANANVTIDDIITTTNSNGEAEFELESGTYGYRVSIDRYETKSGYIVVGDSDAETTVLLRSEEEMVQSAASTLEIEYNLGDDSANITGGIGLLSQSDNGCEISWSSSREDVISSIGLVKRPKEDVDVTLTATITKGSASTQKVFYVTVRSSKTTQETNAAIVAADTEALELKFSPGDSVNSVTSNLVLEQGGENGSTIFWESSNEAVVDSYGNVERPDSDTKVTLTATIMRNDASAKKEFTVTVMAAENNKQTDDEAVRASAAALAIGYAYGDSEDNVTTAVTLSETGSEGTIIQWISSNPAIVTSYGGVVRQSQDVKVTLTAVLTRGNASQNKVFNIIVKAKDMEEIPPDSDTQPTMTDEERVTADKNALSIGYAPGDTANAVTSVLTLPVSGENGSTIMWKSSNTDVVSIFGSVKRPSSDTDVTLTAVIARGNTSAAKEFKITVVAMSTNYESDEDVVERVADAIEIGYATGDNADSVKSSLILPMTGAQDTSITWKSSNTAVITNNGGVTRKNTSVPVTLTATVSRNGAEKTRSFDVTVVQTEKQTINSSTGIEPKQTETPQTTQKPISTPTPQVTSNDKFNDLGAVPWAKEAINTLASKGIISGTSDTTFSPQSQIKRGDFLTLLVRMLGLNGSITDTFADVPSNMYYYNAISIAKTQGIVDGIGDNRFNPEGLITRQDMMMMTCRALDKLGEIDMSNKADLSVFVDSADISSYALSSVQTVVGNNLISGNENRQILPLSLTTRAEAAVFLYQINNK